jgi:hypothetical protein
MRDVVIVGAARTPIGSFLGALAAVPAPKLGAVAIKAALARATVDPAAVEAWSTWAASCPRAGPGPGPPGRPRRRPAPGRAVHDVNKVCGSGLETIILAARAIAVGEPRSRSPAAWSRCPTRRTWSAACAAASRWAASTPSTAWSTTACGTCTRTSTWATAPSCAPRIAASRAAPRTSSPRELPPGAGGAEGRQVRRRDRRRDDPRQGRRHRGRRRRGARPRQHRQARRPAPGVRQGRHRSPPATRRRSTTAPPRWC